MQSLTGEEEEEVIMSQEAEVVLKRIEDEVAKLNSSRDEITFDLETWGTWSGDLKKTSLSNDQARRLLFSLAAFCTPSTDTVVCSSGAYSHLSVVE